MRQPTVFERDSRLVKPSGRAGWNASFEPVLVDLRSTLVGRPPHHLAALAGAAYDAEAGELRLTWLGAGYRITWPELMVFDANGAPCPASIQGLFLYYLSMADGTPPGGAWLAFRELPNGWLYHQAFHGYTGAVLVRTVGDDMAALARAAQLAGGVAIAAGDCGYAFQVLPQVRLAIVYWRGDEEFPADAQVLFDAAAAHYLPIDGLAFLGSHLVQQIVQFAG